MRTLSVGDEAGGRHIDDAALFRLMTWLSPSYPVGAYSYSSGIEWAVESGDIRDAASLHGWLAGIARHGSIYCDAALFTQAHRAAARSCKAELEAVAEVAAALVGSKERFVETTAQGEAFLAITRAVWPCDAFELLGSWSGPVAYPIAVALACAGHGIPFESTLGAFLHALAANLVSAGQRLIPLGQTEGQRVFAALEPVLAQTAARARANTSLDAISGAALRADMASMHHETQYTRLFRS
jgi:urease accessory protein